jgi:hypothetical protein
MSFPYDIVIECPHCHSRTMKEIDRPKFYKDLDEKLVTMGCYMCGHIAIFDRMFLEEHLHELLKIGKYPTK